MEWKIEELKFYKEKQDINNKDVVFICESTTPREEKIKFVDNFLDGKLTYVLNLIDKFNQDKEAMPKDDFGRVKTVSLLKWLKKNDTRKLVDDWREYGYFTLLGTKRDIRRNGDKITNFDYYDDLVDETFHRQLKQCVNLEYRYFLEHDEYSILKRKLEKFNHEYGTSFNIILGFSSNDCVYIYSDDDKDKREITMDELKLLISKYEELEKIIEKLSSEINIKY